MREQQKAVRSEWHRLDQAVARADADSFFTAVRDLYHLSPPALVHSWLDFDCYPLVEQWHKETRACFDPELLFARFSADGRAVLMSLVAMYYFVHGNKDKALPYASAAVEDNPFYVPGCNLLADLKHPEISEALKHCVCPFPFKNIHLKQKGGKDEMRFCCWTPFSVGNPIDQGVQDLWHSEAASEFRRSILAGDYQYCNKLNCSIIGERQSRCYPKDSDYGVKLVRSCKPDNITLAYDDSCNLSCPSCRSQPFVADARRVEAMNAMFQEGIVGLLQSDSPITLTASGTGDPFASRHFREMLCSLDYRQFPKLKIRLLTNGLLLGASMWKRLEGIRQRIACISISIDAATPATYAKLRSPGDWFQLLDNLAFLKSIKSGSNFYLIFNFCVQAENFREIPDFVELARGMGADEVNFQRILNWGTLSVGEYRSADVCHERHPDYPEVRKILNSLTAEGVNLRLSTGLPRLLETAGRPA